MTRWLVDTGPLIALLCGDDRHHKWAVEQSRQVPATVFTCEAVMAEALFLLRRAGHDGENLFDLIEAGFLRIEFALHPEYRAVRDLLHRYRERPMGLADACLVRMAELSADSCVWTADRDFENYRKHGRRSISLVAPW
jgi:predicted nucleic acid-binding protein